MVSSSHLPDVKENISIVQATRAQLLNWWGYDFELFLVIIEKDLKDLPEVTELLEERRLNMAVERN